MTEFAADPVVKVPNRRAFYRGLANTLLLLFLAGCVISIAENPAWQRDARVRYFVVKTWQAGLNPFDHRDVTRVAGQDFDTDYIYPPDTIPLVAPFALLSLPTVRALWLGIELLLAAGVVICWQRFFLEAEDRASPAFFALCLFGLGNTFLTELRASNVSLLEQGLLWWGLAAWLRGRFTTFAVLLCLAASFKLTLLALSVLLLLPPASRWLHFVLVWVASVARFGVDYLWSPRLTAGFFHALLGGFGGAQDGGRNNPCAIEVLKDLVHFSNDELTGKEAMMYVAPLYVLGVLSVLGVSWLAWREICRHRAGSAPLAHADENARGIRLICLVCFAYALTVPRMKDYSYILLLFPVWYSLKATVPRYPQAWLALIFVACMSNFSEILPIHSFYVLWWKYIAFFTAFVAWLFLVTDALLPRFGPESPREAAP